MNTDINITELPELHAGLTYPADQDKLRFLAENTTRAINSLGGKYDEGSFEQRSEMFNELRIIARSCGRTDFELIDSILRFRNQRGKDLKILGTRALRDAVIMSLKAAQAAEITSKQQAIINVMEKIISLPVDTKIKSELDALEDKIKEERTIPDTPSSQQPKYENWFIKKKAELCTSKEARIMSERDCPEAVFSLGVHLHSGVSKKTDKYSLTVWRALRLPSGSIPTDPESYYPFDNALWEISPVWASNGSGKSASQISGIIHTLHRKYQFSNLVLEPGGGGQSLAKELESDMQQIAGTIQKTTPLTDSTKSAIGEGWSIVIPFTTHSQITEIFDNPAFTRFPDGIIEAIHHQAADMLHNRQIRWPIYIHGSNYGAQLHFLNSIAHDLFDARIRVDRLANYHSPLLTKAGFRMFHYPSGGILAWSALHGLAGVLLAIKKSAQSHMVKEQPTSDHFTALPLTTRFTEKQAVGLIQDIIFSRESAESKLYSIKDILPRITLPPEAQ